MSHLRLYYRRASLFIRIVGRDFSGVRVTLRAAWDVTGIIHPKVTS